MTKTYLLWQCNSKSIINVCHAFSLLSASSAVGIKAKHRVITSRASQQTCSSSMSGSFPAFVCENKQECTKWVQKTIPRNPTGSKVYHQTQTQTTALYTEWLPVPSNALRSEPKHCVGWLELPEFCFSLEDFKHELMETAVKYNNCRQQLHQLVLLGAFISLNLWFCLGFFYFVFLYHSKMAFKTWKTLLLKQRKAIVLYN